MFITFEGLDGSGKTTQAQRLANHLTERGKKVVLTREPGGTHTGELIRSLIMNTHHLSPIASLMLFSASRAQLIAEVIKPALQRGEVVICDRFVDSTFAYQGYGEGIDELTISRAIEASVSILPDVTFYLKVPTETALIRCVKANRLDMNNLAFYERVALGYDYQAWVDKKRIKVIDGDKSADDVFEAICGIIGE